MVEHAAGGVAGDGGSVSSSSQWFFFMRSGIDIIGVNDTAVVHLVLVVSASPEEAQMP